MHIHLNSQNIETGQMLSIHCAYGVWFCSLSVFIRSFCVIARFSPICWLLISYSVRFGLIQISLCVFSSIFYITIAECETNWICYGYGHGHSPFVPLLLFDFRARFSRCSSAWTMLQKQKHVVKSHIQAIDSSNMSMCNIRVWMTTIWFFFLVGWRSMKS